MENLEVTQKCFLGANPGAKSSPGERRTVVSAHREGGGVGVYAEFADGKVADRARRETQRDNAYSRRPVEVAPDLRSSRPSTESDSS